VGVAELHAPQDRSDWARLLRTLHEADKATHAELAEAVDAARNAGVPWRTIAYAVGLTNPRSLTRRAAAKKKGTK
jgi:hypothetical protein